MKGEGGVESGPGPAGQKGGHRALPPLAEALVVLGPEARQAMIEVIVLHREFPAWAVWPPHGGRPWVAVRPASARAPGPDLPMIWTTAPTAAELAARMESVNAQLSPP